MISNVVQNILNTIREKSVQKGIRDIITRDKSVNQFNALDYGDRIETGVKEIQAAASSANTISSALPLHIYIPPGTHTLSAPITITRHNVTLTADGGARIIPPANQAAILRFHEEKNVGSYNINLVTFTTFGITFRQIRAGTIANRFLFIGAGNTKITKHPEANYQSGAVTNNAGAEYKSVTIA